MSFAPTSTEADNSHRLPFSDKPLHSLYLPGTTTGAGADDHNEDSGPTLHDESSSLGAIVHAGSDTPSGINEAQAQSQIVEFPFSPRSQPTVARWYYDGDPTCGPRLDPCIEVEATPPACITPSYVASSSSAAIPEQTLGTVCLPPSLAKYALTSTASPSPPLVPILQGHVPRSPVEWQGGSFGRSLEWTSSHSSWDSRPVVTMASSSKMPPTFTSCNTITTPIQDPSSSPPSDSGSHVSDAGWTGHSSLTERRRYGLLSAISAHLSAIPPSAASSEPQSSIPAVSAGSGWATSSQLSSSLDREGRTAVPIRPFQSRPSRVSVPGMDQSNPGYLQGAASLEENPRRTYDASSNPDFSLDTVSLRYLRTDRSFDDTTGLSFTATTDPHEPASTGAQTSMSDSGVVLGGPSVTDLTAGEQPSLHVQ